MIGTQEAIFNGVPIIGVPIYADQYNNLLIAKQAGYGQILQYHDISEENFEKMLIEVITDEKYAKMAKEVSRRFKDRPMTALDTAIFWLEYVIRNKGADFMKNPAINMSWIAYSMIDVFAFIFVSLVVLIFITVKIVCVLLQILSLYWIGNEKYKKS